MKFGIVMIIGLLIGGLLFWKDIRGFMVKGKQWESGNMKSEKKDRQQAPDVDIAQRWDLPPELTEISGLAWMDDNRFACVQDEEGTIYIYNRTEKKIEKKISFAAPGDYEGLTLNGNTAYVVRADGVLYEVNMDAGKTSTKEYNTPLTVDHNVEGLVYDKKHNRLLLAIKGDEPHTRDYKGIYAFDLTSKKLDREPVIRINLKHELLQAASGKKDKPFMPSALGIHPLSGDYYVSDGPKSKLLIMDASGNIKRLLELGKDFKQPEGISFSPQGELFISNEGGKGSGNILQVALKN